VPSDNSLTNGKEFYQETGILFKKDRIVIRRLLVVHGIDDDLEVKVEGGELPYHKAFSEPSNRKPQQNPHLKYDLLSLFRA